MTTQINKLQEEAKVLKTRHKMQLELREDRIGNLQCAIASIWNDVKEGKEPCQPTTIETTTFFDDNPEYVDA